MNIFQFAANVEQAFTNHFRDMSGYQSFTTFASDMAIADCYGEKSVRDTFKRVTKNWLDDYKYYTEFVMVLNYLCWVFYDLGKEDKSRLYAELFETAQDKLYRKYAKDKEATAYIYRTLD